MRYAMDSSKLKRELGWQPKYTDTAGMREGLRQTIEWYASHREWWERDKATTEAKYRAAGEKPIKEPRK